MPGKGFEVVDQRREWDGGRRLGVVRGCGELNGVSSMLFVGAPGNRVEADRPESARACLVDRRPGLFRRLRALCQYDDQTL